MLKGIAPAPKGNVKVEISFEIDADGILEVTAIDTATGNAGNMTIDIKK